MLLVTGCGFRGKAQSAEGKALEFSDISDLSTFTLCAMRYALCRVSRNAKHATRNTQPVTRHNVLIKRAISSTASRMPVIRAREMML